jgi:hypothetical protein
MKLKNPLYTLATALWAGLFFFQGPVFYQMLVMVVLVLWLFDSQRFWRSFFLVIVCSIWAGFTRINWIPMPGLIAASLYLLEQPIQGKGRRAITGYLAPPAAWALAGGVVGLLAQNLYALTSGLDREVIYGYASSDLLWYRLWPNLSYPIGILPSIFLVTGPILVFVVLAFRKWKNNNHPIRIALLTAGLIILFAGGLVVSVKIGGAGHHQRLSVFWERFRTPRAGDLLYAQLGPSNIGRDDPGHLRRDLWRADPQARFRGRQLRREQPAVRSG